MIFRSTAWSPALRKRWPTGPLGAPPVCPRQDAGSDPDAAAGCRGAALALSDVRARLHEQGAEVVGNSSAELAAYVATEIPKWASLARQAGVKPE